MVVVRVREDQATRPELVLGAVQPQNPHLHAPGAGTDTAFGTVRCAPGRRGWGIRDAAPHYRLVLVVRHVAEMATKDGPVLHRLQPAARAKLALRGADEPGSGGARVRPHSDSKRSATPPSSARTWFTSSRSSVHVAPPSSDRYAWPMAAPTTTAGLMSARPVLTARAAVLQPAQDARQSGVSIWSRTCCRNGRHGR